MKSLLLSCVLAWQITALAQTSPAPSPSPDEIWSALKTDLMGKGETPRERGDYMRETAVALADRAREFYTAHPDHRAAFDARLFEISRLQLHDRATQTNAHAARISAAQTALRSLPGLSPMQRARLRDIELDDELLLLPLDQRLQKKGRTLIAEFPAEMIGYLHLITAAGRLPADEGLALAREILSNNSAPAQAKTRAQALLTRLTPTDQPYDLKFAALDGQPIDLADFRGKPVLLICWASWCKPCIAEIPELKKLYARWHDAGLVFIGLSGDKTREPMEKAIAQHHIPWPQLFHPEGTLSPEFKKLAIVGIPQLFLISPEGKLLSLKLDATNFTTELDTYMTAFVTGAKKS